MNKHTRSVSLINGHTEEMTDAEIIKALECLKGVEVECIGCAYQKCGYPMCREEVALDALDLINHQQAQIKKLEKIERLATKTIEKQSAEIERYESEHKDFVRKLGDLHSMTIMVMDRRNEIKSEAIKEFWKRFDKVLCENIGPSKRVYWKISSDGNNLVKEMTEVSE